MGFPPAPFATYGQAVILASIGNNLVARYQKRLFEHLLRLGLEFFNDTRSGRLAAAHQRERASASVTCSA